MPLSQALEELELQMLILNMCPQLLTLNKGEEWAIIFCVTALSLMLDLFIPILGRKTRKGCMRR